LRLTTFICIGYCPTILPAIEVCERSEHLVVKGFSKKGELARQINNDKQGKKE